MKGKETKTLTSCLHGNEFNVNNWSWWPSTHPGSHHWCKIFCLCCKPSWARCFKLALKSYKLDWQVNSILLATHQQNAKGITDIVHPRKALQFHSCHVKLALQPAGYITLTLPSLPSTQGLMDATVVSSCILTWANGNEDPICRVLD